ncbi:hypothetical protein MCGE09_00480 [Thaumarchaeota archaeon SCGC AB-539-E09]|nr:hypothetical protein MCGE09_00480 [Thaumarchaeota archaeon SCGC AB-539-E09]
MAIGQTASTLNTSIGIIIIIARLIDSTTYGAITVGARKGYIIRCYR